MTQGVVLSHTRMGGNNRGFCTNILIHPGTPQARQIRLRRAPNENLYIDTWYNEASMNEYWQVGRVVDVNFQEVDPVYRRITHPEDVIAVGKPTIYKDVLDHAKLAELCRFITFDSVLQIYPSLVVGRYTTSKAYTPADAPLGKSVAYVRCQSLSVKQDQYGKPNVDIVDQSGAQYFIALKDEVLIEHYGQSAKMIATVNPILLRLALATPWQPNHMNCEVCYLMASWAALRYEESTDAPAPFDTLSGF